LMSKLLVPNLLDRSFNCSQPASQTSKFPLFIARIWPHQASIIIAIDDFEA
jgi:hypothetical protein